MSKCARSSGVFLLLVVLIGFPLVISLEAVGGPGAAAEEERVFRDYWMTPPDGPEGGTYQDVTIPFGFFGPECDGFEGRVHFVGSPLDPGTTGNADTVLERSADPVSAHDAEGTTNTVTLRLTELSLVSKDPIAVECDDGLSLWHVHVGLSSEAPWAGWMTATKTHEDGGTFDSVVYVQPLLTFTNVDDPGDVLVFDMADVSDPAELVAAEVPFVLRVEASIARDDPDSVSGENVGTEFIPGIESDTHSRSKREPTDDQMPNPVQEPVQELAPPVVHQAPGHQHCVEPPPEGKGSLPPRMPLGGKFRRVDIHGVPMPDRSPTGEGEDDRLPNMAYIDMYDLAPLYSVTDAAVPVEGGELTLEFRRTSGIRSFRHSTDPDKQGVTYPSDSILGLGWDTNLASRIIVAFDPDEDDPTKNTTARVTDEVGTSYQYFDRGEMGEAQPFAHNMFHSFNNNAVRAKLFRQGADTLVLVKVFGTRLTYEKIGRFTPPNPAGRWEDYYRLADIEDRNGNKLEYVYDSADPNDRMSFLVTEIHEQAHPERKLSFSYIPGTGDNGEDRGDRLIKVTDPLGRETNFTFGLSGGQPWDLLVEVRRAQVPDAENGGALTQPTVTFSYHAVELPVEETETPPSLPAPDPSTKNRYVGLSSVTDARGHVTTFTYTEDFFPSSITASNKTFYQKRIRLTGASTVDGPVVLTQEQRSAERVITRSQDTVGNVAKYDFVAQFVPTDNLIGTALYVTQLTRTTEALPSDNTAVFQWTADPFANLIHVTDMNANTIDYTYDSLLSQQSNQPTTRTITDTGSAETIVINLLSQQSNQPTTRTITDTGSAETIVINLLSQQSNQPTTRTITDTGSAETIATTYEYGAFSKMTRIVDGEGKETTYTLDPNGNRTEVHEELGKTTVYQYAPDGFLTQITDPDGRVTTFSRIFTPGDLSRQYTLTSIVTGYSSELNLDTETVYDVMGSEVEMTDPEENVYTHEYDALYRRTRTTNPAVEESPGGPLVTSTREFTYTLNGSVVEEKDDNGNVTANQYDLMNRFTETRRRMTDPASNSPADLITVNTYNPVGLVQSTTDPNGNVTQFVYDALLRISRKTVDANVLAYAETYEYGANAGSGAFVYTGGWQPTRVINRRGFAQDTTYDGFYRAIRSVRRQTDGAGIPHDDPAAPNEPATSMTYNKVHNQVAVTVLAEAGAGGDRTTYTFYDDLHRPTISLLDFDGDGNDGAPYTPEATFVNDAPAFAAHDAEDFVTRAAYDLAGNVIKLIDREGNPTDTTYDGAGRLIKVEQAAVAGGRPTTTTVYDDNGNEVLVTDPKGNQTQMTYDARNRMTRSILDLNGDGQFDPSRPGPDIVTDTHYDLVGNVIQTMDPNGNVAAPAYDRAYRVETVTAPEVADAENAGQMTHPVTRMEYDKNGNITKVIDPRDAETKSEYDGLNRVTSGTRAFGTTDAVTTTTAYDENSNVVSMTLDNGPAPLQTTTFTFDPFDRQITETWPGGNPTTTAYYRNHLVQVVTDPKAQKIESDYDRADRAVATRHKRTDQSVEETRTFTYDKMDNVLTATDLNGTTTYTYDAIYRVLTESRDDAGQTAYTVTSAYDLNGNRTTVTYPQTGRTLTSTYDRADRLTQVVDSVGTKTTAYTVTSAYDLNGKRTTVTHPRTGRTLTSTYDRADRLTQVVEGMGSRTTTYTYDANSNRLSCTLPNGVVDTFTYDALNRVLTHVSTAGGPNVYSVDYTYDLANNRRTIDETVQGQPTRNLAYNYDDQYRLTSESWLGNSYSYTYDLAGNRLTKTVNGLTTTYAHNVRNELLTETTSGVTTSYTHDLNGNRAQKAVGGGGPTTDYIWDVNDRLIEAKIDSATVFQAGYDYRTRRLIKTEEGAPTTYFRYDGGVSFQELEAGTVNLNVEFIRASALGGGIGSILYSDRSAAGGADEYFTYNAVGHTVALTDDAVGIVKTYLYEAFGAIVSTLGASDNNRLANTKERDVSIGLDNHGFRYYDPAIGRYISRDPMGYADGLNVYPYAHSNPINNIDPLGLSVLDVLQLGLDLGGMVPKFGIVADLLNVGISLCRGNTDEAALSGLAAIPAYGLFPGGAKISYKVRKALAALRRTKQFEELSWIKKIWSILTHTAKISAESDWDDVLDIVRPAWQGADELSSGGSPAPEGSPPTPDGKLLPWGDRKGVKSGSSDVEKEEQEEITIDRATTPVLTGTPPEPITIVTPRGTKAAEEGAEEDGEDK